MREEPLFLHTCSQYELSFRTENVLPMKMVIFKMSGLTNCDKILKFANFENGGYRYSAGHTACYVKNIANFFTANGE